MLNAILNFSTIYSLPIAVGFLRV